MPVSTVHHVPQRGRAFQNSLAGFVECHHVRLAANGLRALAPGGQDEVETYRRAVPYPLAAARAKGRRFTEAARRRAGLSPEFIAFVRDARSSQEQTPGREPSRDE